MPRFRYAYKIILYQTGPKIKLLLKKNCKALGTLPPYSEHSPPITDFGYAPGW